MSEHQEPDGLLQNLDDWQEVFADEWGCVKEATDLLKTIQADISKFASSEQQGMMPSWNWYKIWLENKLEGK